MMQHQYHPVPTPGPNQQVVYIDQPGYYLIPKEPQRKSTKPKGRTTRKKQRPYTNPFSVEIQPWHLILLLVAAALIAICIVFG